MKTLDWRYLDDGLWATDQILAASESAVLDMLSLHASPWVGGLLEAAVKVTVSNLAGSEVLVLEAGPLYLDSESTTVVGFLDDGFRELNRTGTDLVLHQDDDGPDKVFTTDGGVFLVAAQLATR